MSPFDKDPRLSSLWNDDLEWGFSAAEAEEPEVLPVVQLQLPRQLAAELGLGEIKTEQPTGKREEWS